MCRYRSQCSCPAWWSTYAACPAQEFVKHNNSQSKESRSTVLLNKNETMFSSNSRRLVRFVVSEPPGAWDKFSRKEPQPLFERFPTDPEWLPHRSRHGELRLPVASWSQAHEWWMLGCHSRFRFGKWGRSWWLYRLIWWASYQQTLRVLNYVCTPVISCRSATNTARTKLLLGERLLELEECDRWGCGDLGLNLGPT